MPAFNRSIIALNLEIARSLTYRGVVVDLGCGDAPYRDDILRTAESYVGIDWPRSLHGLSRTSVIADLSVGVPLQPASADMVVCFQALEHQREPKEFLAECYRILRPGGRLVLTVPFLWHVHEEPYDFYRFTRFGLAYLLERTRFAKVEIRENTGFWKMWVLQFNYYSARLPLGPLSRMLVPLWWLDQALARLLDALSSYPEATASYTVIAEKA